MLLDGKEALAVCEYRVSSGGAGPQARPTATGASSAQIPASASTPLRMLRASVEPGQFSKRRSLPAITRKRFDRRSLAAFTDNVAGLYVSEIVPQHRFAEAQHL